MTLAKWQQTLKPVAQILFNCSEFDRLEDGWVPFPVGMQWQFMNYAGPSSDIQIGPHDETVMCAVDPGTDVRRRVHPPNRPSILATLARNGIPNDLNGMSSGDYLRALPRFKFAVSPEGNGIDCHRTYEALMAGCVPVVEGANADVMRGKYGDCPILYIDDADFSQVTPAFLEAKYAAMLETTWDFSRLFLDTYDPETRAQIIANGRYWGQRLSGRRVESL